jgi:tetratricopeptide (TPR) repeat protein
MRSIAEAAIETFTELGDSRGLAVSERYLSIALTRLGHTADAAAVLERALVHAESSGDRAARRDIVGTLCNVICAGPTPVPDAIHRFEDLLRSSRDDHVLEAVINRFLAVLVAMSGRSDRALDLVETSSRVLDDVNYLTASRTFRYSAAEARALAGDHAGAERELLEMWHGFTDTDEGIDERAMHAASFLALLYCDDERWDDAAACLAFGGGVSLTESTSTAIRRLAAGARLAAHEGRAADAVALALRALESAERTDYPTLRAVAWLALAEARRVGGETAEADAAVAEAIRLYEAKGNVVAAAALRPAFRQ